MEQKIKAISYIVLINHSCKSIFPLGGLLKSDVRDLAKETCLHNHDRKDSTVFVLLVSVHLQILLVSI